MKYIDADLLRKEIERRRLQNRYIDTDGYEQELFEIIDSLQQEQPSGDERIRKWLVDYFKSTCKSWIHRDITPEEILAWLEKQKEHPMPDSTELIEMWDKEKAMLKEKDFRDDAWRLAYNAFMDGFARGTCVKLEQQKEQMPEWSEKDEKTIDDAYCWLCEYAGSLIQKNYGKSSMLYGIANKLKSLRPSWKPSEEQIYSLGTVVKGYNECAVGSVGYHLKEMYEQLKKLM